MAIDLDGKGSARAAAAATPLAAAQLLRLLLIM